MSDAAPRTNRLAGSSSPYLLLHAHNPVDWYPWGEEAFARARAEDKPIFLSVGYSTCYWCHVMERESFSSEEVAALMNRDFVNVKVDREERPDLDEVSMAATQLMTGQGGWPTSLFLTPQLAPFFAGTYFPPEDRWGRPGFRSLLDSLAAAWRTRRAEVEEQAREVVAAIRHHMDVDLPPAAQPPGEELAAASLRSLAQRFDPTWGGFGEAPKFPTPSNLLLLLELAPEDEHARTMLAATLDQMARGGIHDQLGGGFHRYATDREWKVPHFEKMLYDNGALLEIYARAWALLREPELARVVRSLVAFLERELSAPGAPPAGGGFWSAIDAETHGHEGAFHVWTREELHAALGEEDAAFLAPLYGFDRAPFFEGTHYVLHLPQPLAEQAERRRTSYAEILAAVEPLRQRLFAARTRREPPQTDDKVLADWNGLAIAGLATAGRLLGEPEWIARAERAADFVLQAMRPAGVLLHVWRGGAAGDTPAFLADYAFLMHGLLALHEATGKESWLAAAVELAREQRQRLAHPEGGFYNAEERPDLLARTREVFDGASPAANGVAVLNLLALAERTGDASFHAEAERALCAFAPLAQAQAAAARTMAVAARRAARMRQLHAPSDADAAKTTSPLASAPGAALAALGEQAASLVHTTLDVDAPTDEDGWQRFLVRLDVPRGWHVGADTAPKGLVATTIEGDGCEVRDLRLPPPSRQLTGFGDAPLPVWEGSIEITGALRRLGAPSPSLRLVYQVCDEARCLPAVSVELPLG